MEKEESEMPEWLVRYRNEHPPRNRITIAEEAIDGNGPLSEAVQEYQARTKSPEQRSFDKQCQALSLAFKSTTLQEMHAIIADMLEGVEPLFDLHRIIDQLDAKELQFFAIYSDCGCYRILDVIIESPGRRRKLEICVFE